VFTGFFNISVDGDSTTSLGNLIDTLVVKYFFFILSQNFQCCDFDSFLQSCFPPSQPQPVLVSGVIPPQVEDFAVCVEPHEVPLSLFLQAVRSLWPAALRLAVRKGACHGAAVCGDPSEPWWDWVCGNEMASERLACKGQGCMNVPLIQSMA